ncbi:AAA family ATPase [Salana multivorans]
MPAPLFDTVWINGSVGTGKTTTAERLGDELRRRGVPGAMIDVDALRRAWPAPEADPFCSEVALANVRSVAANFRDRGAQVIVVAGVLESPEELMLAAEAVGSPRALQVRLTVDPETALSRLRERHADDAELDWHERRHPELASVLDRAGFEDELVIDTTELTADDVAHRIADHLLSGC